jgi:cell division protein FtsX
MPDATDYPLKGKATVEAPPRGPVAARAVGALPPGQEGDVDWGIFVPVRPLLRTLGQYDAGADTYRYPMAIVSIEDGTKVDVKPLGAVIAQELPGTSGTDDAWDRTAFEASYGATERALDGWLAIVSTVLVVMLVAGVSDTTLVAVAERRREIATLRAVGLSRRQVSRLVTGEVLTLAAIGLVVGLVAGATLALVFGHLHETTGGEGVFLAPVHLGPWVVAGATLLALGAAALAAAYPARRAARGSPTEALRYE